MTGIADPLIERITYDRSADLATAEELTGDFLGGVLLSILMSGGEKLLSGMERYAGKQLSGEEQADGSAAAARPDARTLWENVRNTLDEFRTDLERAMEDDGAEGTTENAASRTETAERRTRVDNSHQKSIINKEKSAMELSSHNMHNSSDALFERSKHIPPIQGYDDVFVHGDRWSVSTKDADGNDIDLPNEAFIKNLRSLNLENNAIRLCACEAGAEENGIASYVAREMNMPVMAPTTHIWIAFPDENGISEMWLYEELSGEEHMPDYDKPGRWRLFKPDGSVEEIN